MENDISDKRNSLKINFIFNAIRTMMTLLFPLITFTYTSRILGVESVGKLNFTRSYVQFFLIFAMLGMNNYGNRECARVRNDIDKLSKLVHELLIINAFSTIVSYILFIISYIYVDKLKDYSVLLIIYGASIALNSMGMEWLYCSLEKYRYITIRTIIFQIVSLILMFLLVRTKEDIFTYAVIHVIATYGFNILNFVNCRNYIKIKQYSHYNLTRHLKPLGYLMLVSISVTLYTVLDSTMLGLISGDYSVGIYTAGVKTNKLIMSGISSLGVILTPRMSYFIEKREFRKVKELAQKAYQLIFFLSIPLTLYYQYLTILPHS